MQLNLLHTLVIEGNKGIFSAHWLWLVHFTFLTKYFKDTQNLKLFRFKHKANGKLQKDTAQRSAQRANLDKIFGNCLMLDGRPDATCVWNYSLRLLPKSQGLYIQPHKPTAQITELASLIKHAK